nr:hypothetical protein [Paraburkholderia caribensis]
MPCSAASLRSLVEHWLTPDSHTSLRVTEFSRTSVGRCRYVRVEAKTSSGPVAMFFFRHENGMWGVFPPGPNRPFLGIS